MAQIQLPNDAVSCGFRLVRPFEWAQLFSSVSCGFAGTEREFLAAGHAYAYVQIDAFTRRKVA